MLISEISFLPDGIFNGNETRSIKKKTPPKKSDSVSPDHPVGKQTSRSFAAFAAISQRPGMMLFVLVSLQPHYHRSLLVFSKK